MSKNKPTIEHLAIACRHVDELRAAGVTENLAIRTLELFADVFAKCNNGGNATPHHVNQVKLWSVAALKLKRRNPNAKPRDFFRVEHGTPQRGFARLVKKLYDRDRLTDRTMANLAKKHWLLAVITLEEDARLVRSLKYNAPNERWAAAGIRFPA